MSDEPHALDRITFSNAITLSGTQWLGLIAFAVVVTFAVPALWNRVETFQPDVDYRVPRELSDDYWFYERYVDLAAADHDVLVLGDSVIWGEFVNRHETLSHYLNVEAKKERFANIGLNGAHPLALEGLVGAYAGSVAGKKVLLLCNPLWLSSLKTDLQNPDADVNHSRLVPQFWPIIPAYKVEISPRMGVLVERRVPITKWANHLQQAYYRDDGPNDIPGWTLKHPYENPLEPLTRPLPESDDKRREDAKSWRKRGLTPVDMDWIDLQDSLQWHAFQRTVDTLQRRGNRVFVLVGPFNENMLTSASQTRYQKTKTTITDWLSEHHVPHLAPKTLPSDLYADASHPLAAGYEALARTLFGDAEFVAAMKP